MVRASERFNPGTGFSISSRTRAAQARARNRAAAVEIGRVGSRKKATLRSRRRNVGAPSLYPRTGRSYMPYNIKQNIRGLLNAHAPVKPRIMDGAVSESQTHNNRTSTTVTFPTSQIGLILMQPDCLVPLVYRTSALGLTTSIRNNANDLHLDTTNMPAGTGAGFIRKQGDIDRWRVVSQSVKIDLLNTTETNDGYFQCFRVSSTAPVAEQRLTDSVIPNEGFLEPESSWLGTLQTANNAATERPSYFSAPLKDIGKYEFHLNPFAESHPFIHIPDNFEIQSSASYVPGPPQSWTIGRGDSLAYQKLFDSVHDKTFDMLAIVIFAGSTPSGSQLLVDSAQNLEVVYETDSALARYHQPATSAPAAQNAVHQHQTGNRTSAATPAQPMQVTN